MRVIAALLIASLLLLPVPTSAQTDWVLVANRVGQSLVRLDGIAPDGSRWICSAFSINKSKRFFLTAAHCFAPVMGVGPHQAQAIYFNDRLDLMVVWVPGLERTALSHRPHTAPRGLPVAALGFAEGWPAYSLRAGHIQLADILLTVQIGQTELTERFMLVDFAVIGGQSGGPVVDSQGRVVSVVQAGNSTTGLGRPLDIILEAIGAYWE
jgi:S1-C subfamily serine protease